MMKVLVIKKSNNNQKDIVLECDNVFYVEKDDTILLIKDNAIVNIYDAKDVEYIIKLDCTQEQEKTVHKIKSKSISKETNEPKSLNSIQILKSNLEDIYSNMSYQEKMLLGYILKSLSLFLENKDIQVLKELSNAINDAPDTVFNYFYLYCILKLLSKK